MWVVCEDVVLLLLMTMLMPILMMLMIMKRMKKWYYYQAFGLGDVLLLPYRFEVGSPMSDEFVVLIPMRKKRYPRQCSSSLMISMKYVGWRYV